MDDDDLDNELMNPCQDLAITTDVPTDWDGEPYHDWLDVSEDDEDDSY